MPSMKQLLLSWAVGVGAAAYVLPPHVHAVILTACMLMFDGISLNTHILGKDLTIFGNNLPGIRFLFCMIVSEMHPLYLFLIKSSWLAWCYSMGTFSVWWFTKLVVPLVLFTTLAHTMWSIKGTCALYIYVHVHWVTWWLMCMLSANASEAYCSWCFQLLYQLCEL
jgi:hypothetical protein